MKPRHRARAALVAVALLAGCSGPTPSPSPATTQEPTPFTGRPQVLACFTISEAECNLVVDAIAASLPHDLPAPFSVAVELLVCQKPEPATCAVTLDDRPAWATVDFTDGRTQLALSVFGPVAAPRLVPEEQGWELATPVSVAIHPVRPVRYDVGHCGLMGPVDFDGSFWVPIGKVSGDGRALYNAEQGTMTLLGPNLAEYHGESGFSMHLARFPGQRWFICD